MASRFRPNGQLSLPHEFFIPLDNNPQFLGRITVYGQGKFYSCDIDIIFEESKKIFHHVHHLFDFEDDHDLLDSAVAYLADWLDRLKKTSQDSGII